MSSCECEWHTAYYAKLAELDTLKLTYKRVYHAPPTFGDASFDLVPEYDGAKSMRIQKELIDMMENFKCPTNKKTHEGNGKYLGPFAFTLTKSPKDALSVGDMITAARKVMKQKSQPVIKYAWYYEDKGRDDNGDAIHPHIHGMYETVNGRRIETKHWQRAWSIWNPSTIIGAGFRGGYHRPVKLEENYSDYIAKDGGLSESTDNF
jgi:hypothetical protein